MASNMTSEKHLLSILNRPASFSATAPVIERSSDIIKFQQIVPGLSDWSWFIVELKVSPNETHFILFNVLT